MTETPFACGVIAVIRTESETIARTVVAGLAETRVAAIEITLTVPRALELLAEARDAPVPVGIGTVLNKDDCSRAIDLGTRFVVSPHLDESLISMCNEADVFCLPGVLTPTETRRAILAGAPAVKMFPIGAVGGINYIRALAGPFPDLAIVVSGGITRRGAAEYLSEGCLAVCLGREVIDFDAAHVGDIAGVAAYATEVLDEIERELKRLTREPIPS